MAEKVKLAANKANRIKNFLNIIICIVVFKGIVASLLHVVSKTYIVDFIARHTLNVEFRYLLQMYVYFFYMASERFKI